METCRLEPYGLYGDRFCAFYDETKKGWGSYITARQLPELLSYKARLNQGEVNVTAPDGRRFSWDEALLAEIQRLSKRKVSMTRPKAPNFESPELMAVDAASVLIITDASLRKLERLWGKPLDLRRFRANLVVSLEETAWNETDWTDRCLSVGSTVLKIDTICERCSMITIDPDTIERDPSLLKIVNQELALQFGWYASVIQPGEVRTGDKLYFV